jgi:hypothetical protein
MKRIKALILFALISIFAFGQDTIWGVPTNIVSKETALTDTIIEERPNYLTKDSILVHMSIDPDPVSIKVITESLEDNEVLQEVLKLEKEETQTLNENLKKLSNNVDSLPYRNIEAVNSLYDKMGLNVTYWNIKTRRSAINVFAGGLIVFLIIVPLVLTYIFNHDIFVLRTVGNMFM